MTTLDRRQLLLGAAGVAAAWALPCSGAFAAEPGVNQPLAELLAMIPAETIDVSTLSGQIAAFANIAAQLTAVGASAPTDLTDASAIAAYAKATQAMAGPQAIQHALNPVWQTTFGFSVFAIDQSLEFGQPPLVLTIYRGRFKPTAIGAALTASGYKTIDHSGAKVWSLSEDESISITNQANRLALARMNNVALMGTETLIGAPRLDALQAILTTISGKATPVAANAEIDALVEAAPVELGGCLLLSGDSISGAIPIKMALSGVTLGPETAPEGPGSSGQPAKVAKWEWVLLTGSPADAAALGASIEAGLKSGVSSVTNRPYTAFFATWTVGTDAKSPMATLELKFAPGLRASGWKSFIANRDLGFLTGS
jgi:hypothetical protein